MEAGLIWCYMGMVNKALDSSCDCCTSLPLSGPGGYWQLFRPLYIFLRLVILQEILRTDACEARTDRLGGDRFQQQTTQELRSMVEEFRA